MIKVKEVQQLTTEESVAERLNSQLDHIQKHLGCYVLGIYPVDSIPISGCSRHGFIIVYDDSNIESLKQDFMKERKNE